VACALSGLLGRDGLNADADAIGVASRKKTQNALPRCTRSQGPLARPTQNASVRIHGSGRDDE